LSDAGGIRFVDISVFGHFPVRRRIQANEGEGKGAAQAAGILPVVTRLLRPLAAKCPKAAITFASEGVNSVSLG